MDICERDAQRFWAKVALPNEKGCMEWLSAKSSLGYGMFSLGGRAGSPQYAHRVSAVLAGVELIEGTELDHLCVNPGCVNVLHLEVVTHAENMRRVMERNTHCRKGLHRWEEQTPLIKKGRRTCRPCQDDRNRARVWVSTS